MLSLIAAISENRALGNENKLLWSIPEDMKRFKELTLNHPVIMGRKTFESIGRPLPKRTNIIITRDFAYVTEGCIITHSLKEALDEAMKQDSNEVFIIGGGQIYAQAINCADKLYLTVVKGNFTADTYFPDFSDFTTITYKKESADQNHEYTFLELEPKQGHVCKIPD